MTRPAWLAHAVFYDVDASADPASDLDAIAAKLDDLAQLGVNALSVGPLRGPNDVDAAARVDPRDRSDASLDALLAAAHARGVRVCVRWAAPARPMSSQNLCAALRPWFERGVDALRVAGADAVAGDDRYRIGMRRRWREVRDWIDATYRERALIADFGHPEIAIDAGFDVDVAGPDDATGWDTLVLAADATAAGEAYFDCAGRGDFERFAAPFEFQRRRIGDGCIGLPSSAYAAGRTGPSRDGDDLKVLFTFLLTWPHVPFIRGGDELGDFAGASKDHQQAARDSLRHHVERLIYLRVTEADLAAGATVAPIAAGRGYPLVYRRGATLIVALNPGFASHAVALPPLGDAAPVLEHHCHVSHGAGGWQLKIGSRGYAVFTVR